MNGFVLDAHAVVIVRIGPSQKGLAARQWSNHILGTCLLKKIMNHPSLYAARTFLFLYPGQVPRRGRAHDVPRAVTNPLMTRL